MHGTNKNTDNYDIIVVCRAIFSTYFVVTLHLYLFCVNSSWRYLLEVDLLVGFTCHQIKNQ